MIKTFLSYVPIVIFLIFLSLVSWAEYLVLRPTPTMFPTASPTATLAATLSSITPKSTYTITATASATSTDTPSVTRPTDIPTVMPTLTSTNTPTPRVIDEAEFLVNGAIVVTQAHNAAGTRLINIAVRVRDTEGDIIPANDIWCNWDFVPPPQTQRDKQLGQCDMSYEISRDTNRQLVTVTIRGRAYANVEGMLVKTLAIIP